MSVYAVVQFLNGALQKECAVVPIIWLTDNNSICYWPNTKSDVKFKALVKSNAIYESSWKQFDVDTVLHTEDNYDAAEKFMNNYIEQSTTSSDNSTDKTKKIVAANYNLVDSKCKKLQNSDSIITTPIRKCKKKHTDWKMSLKKQKKIVRNLTPISNSDDSEDITDRTENSSTSTENSNENDNLNIEKIKEIKINNMEKQKNATKDFLLQQAIKENSTLQKQLKCITNMQSSSQQISAAPVIKAIQSVSGVKLVKQSSARLGCENIKETSSSTMKANEIDEERQSIAETSSPRSITKILRTNFVLLPEIEFQRIVLSYLQSIEVTYEQVLSTMNTFVRYMNSAGKTILTKPEGLPELPLSTMEQFEKMEKLLAVEENFNYYCKRLASIGGENQRSSVMSMLRFLLTNELATHFNWAGRKKISFKEKKIMDVIYESAKLAFIEINGPSTGDKVIESAVKDWLKLANNRLSYSTTKKMTHTAQTKNSKDVRLEDDLSTS